MDTRKLHGKTIIMDGAHNLQKMSALLSSFKKLYPDVKPAVVIALKHDKDYQDVADLIAQFASRVIVTSFRSSQDLPVQSIDPEILARAFPNQVPVQAIADPLAATRALLQAPEAVGLVK
jgi:dihydrofolate synthase/folylpolyglutamate synthase